MSNRDYSFKKRSSDIFLDLLESITVRGWFNAGPSKIEVDSLLHVAFHIHPNDAERMYQLFSIALDKEYVGVSWVLLREKENRFFLCPLKISRRAEELGSFSEAEKEIISMDPEFSELAARSLIAVSDEVYSIFKKSGCEKFSG